MQNWQKMNNVKHPEPRDEIVGLEPYEPGMSIDELRRKYGISGNIIKLASNENPYGASPKAIEILQSNVSSVSSLYPDNHNFIDAVAKKHDISTNMILVGNGSNDVIDIIARTFLGNDDEAISSEFAFVAYGIATTLSGAKNAIVSAKNFGHDLDGMLARINDKTKVIWIANPNNPTGTFIDQVEIVKFMKKVPDNVVIVLDEAYLEYLSPDDYFDSIQLLETYQNLIVVRTMSKIYGLAGLRLGYAIASPEITNYMNRVRQPFNANTLALDAGMAALSDVSYVALSHKRNNEAMAVMTDGLKSLGLEYLLPHGNFVTVKFNNASANHEMLLREGIIVRPLASYKMPDFLRITIGKIEDVEKLLEKLKSNQTK